MRRLALSAVFFASAGLAQALPPSGQGRKCKHASDCAAPLVCVDSGVRTSCELSCNPARPKCPEDQRCVKDGSAHICRPINDSEGGL